MDIFQNEVALVVRKNYDFNWKLEEAPKSVSEYVLSGLDCDEDNWLKIATNSFVKLVKLIEQRTNFIAEVKYI